MRISVGGAMPEIERRPLLLLALLLRHAGEVVTKGEIFEALWPDRIVTDASLTKCMARLRQAIADEEQSFIKTVHGFGYRFAAPVRVEEAPQSVRPLAATVELKPGDPVPFRPNWKLIERLGTGGFGDAWLGEQPKTHEKRVFKFGNDGIRLAALRREIALVRLLQDGLGPRDDFTRVLDWNLEEPPYFIETQWSSEGNLERWMERMGGPLAVALPTRLDIVVQIADALAAAHSMAVLHKDLKPSNILVHLDSAGKPRIRLSDFGSGRALDPGKWRALGISGFTTEPMLAKAETSSGTPVYRAPELLAGGTPTVQADIYSLGVILYQIVIGDLRRTLAPGWERDVPDELLREDIAITAAGDPAHRLADAAELARRLRALDQRRAERKEERDAEAEAERTRHELDLARARRMPLLALVAVLIVGLGASTWLYLRADAARRAAKNETLRAQTVTQFLTNDLLSAANPFIAADPNITVKDLLASAAGDLDRRFNPDSLDRAEIGLAIGRAYDGLSVPERSLRMLNGALAARRKALGDADPQTQAVRLAIVEMYRHNLDLRDSKRVAQQVLDIGHAAGHLDPETGMRARYAIAWADCQANGNSERCVAPLRPLLADSRKQLGFNGDVTLDIESSLAFALSDAQHFDQAIPMARDAYARTAKVYGPNHLLAQDRKFKLAEVLSDGGHPDEAIALLTEVRRTLLAISGTENEATARAANELAKSYLDAKRYQEALPLFQLALDYHVKARGEHFSETRAGYNNVANCLAYMGREKEAIAVGLKTLALERADIGADHPETIWFENNLANFYERDHQLGQAEATYRDVLDRAHRAFKPGEWDVGHFTYHLGALLAEENKTAEARPYLERSVEILSAALGKDNVRTKRAQAELTALNARVSR